MNKVVSKILMVSMVSAMLFSMVGCGPKEEVEEPSVTPPIEDVQNPTEDVQNPTEDTQKPVEVNVNMDEVVATIQNTLGENYVPNMIWTADEFNSMFNFTGDEYTEFFATVPMMSTHADKLFIAKTDDVDTVKAAFDEYFKAQAEDMMQYPMNINKTKNYQVLVFNDYVFGFVLGGYNSEEPAEDATEEERDAFENSFYEGQNALIRDALDSLFTDGYTGPEIPDNILTGEVEDVDDAEETEDTDVVDDAEVTEDTDVVDDADDAEVTDDVEDAEVKTEADTTETTEDVENVEATEEAPVEEKVVEDTDSTEPTNNEPTDFVE